MFFSIPLPPILIMYMQEPIYNEELLSILDKSAKLFMRFGVQRITMSDIAKELGISKKTLYKHVADKAELIRKAVEMHIKLEEFMCSSCTIDAKDAIDAMLKIGSMVNVMLQQINPALIFDLKKYYRDSWALMEDHRIRFVGQTMLDNIQRGQREGLYRDDINLDIVVKLYMAQAYTILDPDVFPYPQYTPDKTHTVYTDYHIRALVSEKGLALYQQYLKQS